MRRVSSRRDGGQRGGSSMLGTGLGTLPQRYGVGTGAMPVLGGSGTGTVASAFTPASLVLTGWWKGSFTGSPWTPTASAGTSGTNGNLTEATNPPATGSALNSITPADFDGTNDQLANATRQDAAISIAAGSIVSLFNADTAAVLVNDTTFYTVPALFTDSASGFLALAFSNLGVTIGCYNGSTFNGIHVACATGGWHLGQARWNNTTLEVRVDAGAWTTVARVLSIAAANTIRIGRNYNGTAFFDGRIMETLCWQARGSDADFENIRGYVNNTYGLSL